MVYVLAEMIKSVHLLCLSLRPEMWQEYEGSWPRWLLCFGIRPRTFSWFVTSPWIITIGKSKCVNYSLHSDLYTNVFLIAVKHRKYHAVFRAYTFQIFLIINGWQQLLPCPKAVSVAVPGCIYMESTAEIHCSQRRSTDDRIYIQFIGSVSD